MKKLLILLSVLMINACTTKYILMDENNNPIKENRYSESVSNTETTLADNQYTEESTEGLISANEVFVVKEEADSVTYQYKNVRVDEISPLASLYCDDVSYGRSPYLREVSMFRNGFMRATFDCVNIAI